MTVLLTMLLALQLPASLSSKATSAFSDIQKAKTALDSGKSKTSESWLGKAEVKLKAVLDKAPGGSLLGKLDQAHSEAKQGDGQQSQGAIAQAEQKAEKLDPALAGKLGVADEKAQQGDNSGAASDIQGAKAEAADKTGLGQISDAYEKVKAAKTLLHAGDSSKAKSLLDQIPSLPQM